MTRGVHPLVITAQQKMANDELAVASEPVNKNRRHRKEKRKLPPR